MDATQQPSDPKNPTPQPGKNPTPQPNPNPDQSETA